MDFKLFGSILLIVGTSIGAGMLALPIATAELGFLGSLIMLFICWAVMTAGAFLILEVNLWMPLNSNMITMAGKTIGPIGQIISWVTFLLLLYSLLCAYISGGSDLFRHLLLSGGIDIPVWLTTIIFTLIFGSIVFLGIRTTDYVNRGLMLIKFSAYFILVILLAPVISADKLAAGDMTNLTSITALTVTITSFGYASIVPSLRIYFNGDIKKLRLAILIGSLIPLACYIIWDAVIMGVVPLEGENGLGMLIHSNNSTSDLVKTLSLAASHDTITFFTKLFTSFCVLTSFLGASLCLTDFWADGLKLEKKGGNRFIIHTLTYLPPLIIALFFPNAFIKALEYAGVYCIILLILLPAWMAWHGRYDRHYPSNFKVFGGKVLLGFLILFSAVTIIGMIRSFF